MTLSALRGRQDEFQGLIAIVRDITAQREVESQLHQSEKLTALGQLAGGIAHDFNNLLTIINGYGDMLNETLAPEHAGRELVQEIRKAGDRAARLTRQLLTFSRHQVLMPAVLNLNDPTQTGCTTGVGQTFGVEGTQTGSSLCANSVWQIVAVAFLVAGAVAVLQDAAPGSAVTAVETALLSSGPLIFHTLVNQSFHRLDLPAAVAALAPPLPGEPTISSFAPGKGKVGATVVITGTNFTGATSVTFDGIGAAFNVDLPTQISATVPAGATTGQLAFTNAVATAASSGVFTVKHSRVVTLRFSNARGNVTVDDGFNACRSNVTVKLQYLDGGKWKTVATGRTRASGSYNLGNHTDRGKYRTLATKVTKSGDVCLKTLSSTVRL